MTVPDIRPQLRDRGVSWSYESGDQTALGVSVRGRRGYLFPADGGLTVHARTSFPDAVLERLMTIPGARPRIPG